MNRVLVAAVLVLAPVAPASAQQPTIQQQFEAASTALDAEQWAEALRLFETLEARITQSPRTLAVIRVRKATALARLGRRDEAIAALRLGLPGLPADDRSLDADRFVALLGLGEAAELSLDYAGARRHYRAAKAVPLDDRLRLGVYRGLVQTEMFDEAATALADVDEALALARTEATGAQHEGILRTMRGRILLNMGRHAEARDELMRAKDRLGGFTTRVNLPDIVARSDLAIAAMLAGRPEEARRALAYAGSGFQETGFDPENASMAPPPCGNGLEPGDRSVVEFSIRDDGSVGHATPVYASRQGPAALAFAAAVRGWSFDPERIRNISPLFRAALRVELRCSVRPPEPDHFLGRDVPEVAAWLDAHGIASGRTRAEVGAVSATRLREELARREASAGPSSPTLLPLLVAMAEHASVGSAETAALLRRAIPIAAAEEAPGMVIGRLALRLATSEHFAAGRPAWREPVDFGEVLTLPAVRDNPGAIATVRVGEAAARFRRRDDAKAAELLAMARRTPGLAQDDPVLINALTIESVLAAARGDLDAARAAFEAQGPGALPCRSRRERPVNTSGDFPNEALRWGFEGWATIEAQTGGSGDLEQPRTLISYPPFVFDESAERVMGRARLDPVYVPPGATCPHYRQTVQFRIEAF